MVMTRYAIITTATGAITNIVEWDGSTSYIPDEGSEVREATEDAATGGTWDGAKFVAPVILESSRLDVLMAEGPATQVYNKVTEAMVARPAADIAADKTELLGLLQTKLADTGDLTWEQMNKMLALERES